jgi:RimJ/RimL family protein N-acetyltransferase
LITSAQGYIRATEEDDSAWFHRLYAAGPPRFALLDLKREPLMPTLLEVRETLGSKEAARSQSFTLESAEGEIAGFLALRGLNQETGFCEVTPLLLDEAAVNGPLAHWAMDYAMERAFAVMRLRKVTAHALCRETHLREFLLARGFACDGVQREVLFSQGRWMDVLCFSLNNPASA